MSNPATHEPAPASNPATIPDGTGTADATPRRKRRRRRNMVRGTTVFAVSVVAAVAAAVSFMHMQELAARAGEGWRSWLIPLAIDGLVVAASMTMVVRRRAGRKTGWLAWTSITLGITASLAANIAAAEPTLIGRAVAAWPPVALLLAYELLMGQIQVTNNLTASTQDIPRPEHQPDATPTVATASSQPSTTDDSTAMPATTNDASSTTAAPKGTATTALAVSSNLVDGTVSRPALTPILMAVPDVDENTDENVRRAARAYYLKTLAHGLPCTGRELADMYDRCERWGRYQIRAARRTHTTTRTAHHATGSTSPPATGHSTPSAQPTS